MLAAVENEEILLKYSALAPQEIEQSSRVVKMTLKSVKLMILLLIYGFQGGEQQTRD